jgi:hypothetical protein
MTTDTPRTDAAKKDDWVHYTIAMMLERELYAEIANRKKCCLDGNAISDELFDTQLKLKDSKTEVARLSKYVEKLEIYSPENDWSQPEWRKLIGSKEEHEDPDTLFNLYQFRIAHTYEKRKS